MKRSVLILLILLTGCIAQFSKIEKPDYKQDAQKYLLQLPVGWVKSDLPQHSKELFITKDGFAIQNISVKGTKLEEAYPTLKKAAKKEMLASDLADNELAEIKAKSTNAPSISVVENSLATVAGYKAFKLHVKYLNQKGLRIEKTTYGFVDNNFYYTMSYEAPSLHFYNRDLPVFEQVAASFKAQK